METIPAPEPDRDTPDGPPYFAGRNIVIFSDGTGQDGGVRAEQRMSNVYKLYRACRVAPDTAIDPRKQVTFYDPGLGTDTTATGWTRVVRTSQKLLASVAGRGIATNIADCYEFIINHYKPGDRIFLFGFSRGAYTVRSVANLLMLCGVPTQVGTAPLPRFRKATRDIAEEAVYTVLEHGAGHPRGKYEDERFELARRFREKYGSNHETGETHRSNEAPYFIGVFDTVAALGARGLMRIAISATLLIGASVLGAVAMLFPAVVLAGLAFWFFGAAFWWMFFGLILLGGLVGGIWVRAKQRQAISKTIRDFPKIGDVSTHFAEWKGEHFDRLLSQFVTYARSANAIDETREDFARVEWGSTRDSPAQIDGHDRLKQWWFAGNHSDIGGSYPEVESRLSDIALVWMIEEATAIPNGLIIGPVFSNGKKVPRTGENGQTLHLFPAADGVQHCEAAGMQDTLESRLPSFLRRFAGSLGWKIKVRNINPEAEIHPTVVERFALEEVTQCAGLGAYRPEALRNHKNFKAGYPTSTALDSGSSDKAQRIL